jgi:hypothetical protein
MGNTNIPQFGAAGTKNSRDTLTGKEQLTKEHRHAQREAEETGRGRNRIEDEDSSKPLSQKSRNGDVKKGLDRRTDDEKRRRAPDLEKAAVGDPRNPPQTITTEELEALGGHVDTGHSSSDAT